MNQEIEAKFLNVNHEEIRGKLREIGGVCEIPSRLMRRVVIDYPDRRMQKTNSWVRIRDEGDRVTLTYKTSIEHKFGGATEIEVDVSDYEKTIAIFAAMGLAVHTEQETHRETWRLDKAEIVLDEWPWLNPFIEVEAPSRQIVRSSASRLGLDWNDAVFGSITTAYRLQYPDIKKDEHISAIPKIAFGLPRPDWFVTK